MNNKDDIETQNNFQNEKLNQLIPISEMYKGWFLDYASYVILERSVPLVLDGLKPVQRRILHSLKEMHDGRYNKVANVIGHTMKYHPHGDASIGDALIKIGQKELLLDMQGNWGNILTGDRAAAPRYIEVRLSKFALDVVFSPKITNWQQSYDGRSKEPQILPIKFPLLLNHGAEGIAVGLSTKILPHNFNELIDASIAILRGRSKKVFPDFLNGGIADFTEYNDGKRGGKVLVRARIKSVDSNILQISELPFSTTTVSLIDSIVRANEKGKIRIKKIEDNTSENVEILIYLPSGVSIDKTIDALYAFTDCQVSISPLSCVILDEKPQFLGVSDILKLSTNNTKELLFKELEIKLNELEEKWQSLSLEKIFIEERIYRKIEEVDNWDEILSIIYNSLLPFEPKLIRKINSEDIIQLTEIKIKKITRYDLDREKERINQIELMINDVKNNLNNIVDYSINYFKRLKKEYGFLRDRKTEIKVFEKIVATKVAIANKRLYVNKSDGFIGTSLKKDEFVCECSDLDDIIVFKSDGSMLVTKSTSKKFVGKDIIYVNVFKKNDNRTIYNMIYRDDISNKSYVKRFPVKGVTRDKDYLLVNSEKSKILYFTANKNGEAEIITAFLRSNPKLKKSKIDLNFANVLIKNRSVRGNTFTIHTINRIIIKSEGMSTLSGKKIWFDTSINRLNEDSRGEFLGEFSGDDKIIVVSNSGYYNLLSYDLSTHFPDDMVFIQKMDNNLTLTSVYFYGQKKQFYIKRFKPEIKSKKVYFIDQNKDSYLELIFAGDNKLSLEFIKPRNKKVKPNEFLNPSEYINVKGYLAIGKQLSRYPIKNINLIEQKNISDESTSLITNEESSPNKDSQMKINF